MVIEKPAKCIYCGKPATTVDHIPPKNLFSKPRPSDLITVPACNSCNNGASRDDDYFWSRIIIKREVGGHRAVKGVLPTLFRSLGRAQQRGFTRQFYDDIQPVEEFTPGGLYLGTGAGYVPDHDRMLRVVRRTAVGLYFREFGRPMPRSYEMDVSGFSNIPPGDPGAVTMFTDTIRKIVAGRKATVVGDGVFAYSYQTVSDRPRFSVWAMEFFESEAYIGICGPKHIKGRRARPK